MCIRDRSINEPVRPTLMLDKKLSASRVLRGDVRTNSMVSAKPLLPERANFSASSGDMLRYHNQMLSRSGVVSGNTWLMLILLLNTVSCNESMPRPYTNCMRPYSRLLRSVNMAAPNCSLNKRKMGKVVLLVVSAAAV